MRLYNWPSVTVRFYKYEGLGNDFLIIEREDLGDVQLTTKQAIALCDRHLGIGADGVLVLDVSAPSMHVINSDGSVPEMCGNGIRCAALHLARRAERQNLEVDIDTVAGPQPCRVESHGRTGSVTVQMRGASLSPGDIGLRSEAPWLDEPLRVANHDLHVTAVSMGNPHAVTFDDVGEARFELGDALQHDPRFSNGVNVGFVSEREGNAMRLDVLERGAGWTQACGTGAAAAAVAAVETGRTKRGAPLSIRLPGGALTITSREIGQPVQMEGPARFVFQGEVEI
ncbi:MAG: diaminopimelate epimerase [Myxococcales bacterium]|nr:diaminopimelate epimerase [Myxococcales bacterium]MDH3485487.1 diaminopimelate epimerase [Myxococcales bacterium]